MILSSEERVVIFGEHEKALYLQYFFCHISAVVLAGSLHTLSADWA